MKIKLFTTVLLVLFAMALAPVTSWAQVTGQCADCHTMHNSQDGAAMAMEWSSNYTILSSTTTPNAKLLIRSGCLGCHAGTRTAGTDMLANAAKVLASTDPTTEYTLTSPNNLSAGGNFYWVKTTDATGHNVAGIASVDVALQEQPPGFDINYDATSHGGARNLGVATWSTQLTCAGTNGCHGTAAEANQFTAISGAHHGDDDTIDGLTCATSYRFLNGIVGIEDDDWEHTFADNSTNHNQYNGEDRGDASDQTTDTSTISYFCCQCHGVFHSAVDSGAASPWLRHPTDYDMGNLKNVTAKEYQFYNGGSAASAPYSTTAPVASDLSISAGVQATVFDSADDAIVTCISCHRAHGSPYDDLLRWQYNEGNASDIHAGGTGAIGNVGCFSCHTTKDDS